MDNIETIHDRITVLVNTFCKGDDLIFANLLDEAEIDILGYKASIIPEFHFLEKIVKTFNISSSWLLTGKGEMLLNQAQSATIEDKLLSIIKEKDNTIGSLFRQVGRLEVEMSLMKKRFPEQERQRESHRRISSFRYRKIGSSTKC